MHESSAAVDSRIISLYQDNQRDEALKLFVETYQSKLYNLSYRMLGNYDDAMDAVQEILLQVNRSLGSFKGDSSLYTWSYRLATYVCLNFRKKRSKTASDVSWQQDEIQHLLLPVERPNEDPDTMCETKFKQFLIQQALIELPENQRVMLVMHELEGLSVPKAAAILDVSVPVAKARLQRGREGLRRIISRGFVVRGMEEIGPVTPELLQSLVEE